MKYNPQIHHRRSIRLKGYDYSQAGAYFITICCQDMVCRFGKIENGEMLLNEHGAIAYNEWCGLTNRFPNIALDVFQIMPNHIHGVILVGATLAVAQNDLGATVKVAQNDLGATVKVAPTVGDIVGAYKSLVSNRCLNLFKMNNETMGKLWQRNYYEHIIRNEQSYLNISYYIINNPTNWKDDKFYNT